MSFFEIDQLIYRYTDWDNELWIKMIFTAPEVVNFEQISYCTDMWSVGVICYVLVSGLSPFMGDTEIDTMTNVTLGKYNFDDDAFDCVSEQCKDFIRTLLQKDGQWVYDESIIIACSYQPEDQYKPTYIWFIHFHFRNRKRMSAKDALVHPWLIQSALNTELSLTKTKLKRYVIKKRWVKAVNTIIALRRMGAKIDLDLVWADETYNWPTENEMDFFCW